MFYGLWQLGEFPLHKGVVFHFKMCGEQSTDCQVPLQVTRLVLQNWFTTNTCNVQYKRVSIIILSTLSNIQCKRSADSWCQIHDWCHYTGHTTNATRSRWLPFVYAQIKEVFVYKRKKVFLTEVIKISSVDEHLTAVEIVETRLCHSIQLYCHGVVHILSKLVISLTY